MKRRYELMLRRLLSQPAVPFREQAVAAEVRRWAKSLNLAVAADAAGNLLIRTRAAKRAKAAPKWVFAAHMDHPGFLARSQEGNSLTADFLGTVRPEYFKGAAVRFFAGDKQVRAQITDYQPDAAPWPLCTLKLLGSRRGMAVPPGSLGMWDLPAMTLRGRKLSSRACDDAVGCAAVLCAMEEIVSGPTPADVTCLLTRAEEAGLVGAIAASQAGTIPEDALVVAIETSQEQPRAALGDGVVVRVGDRARTWDPSLTAYLAAVAGELARSDKDFRFTRQLMPGGTCESTAYAMWGYRATGLCIPLANYHNMATSNRIASEQVHTGDFESLVKLLVGLARSKGHPDQADQSLKGRLEKLLAAKQEWLD